MSDHTLPEPSDYGQALVSGIRKIAAHIQEWSVSDEHPTADIPLAGGWVVGLLHSEADRIESDPTIQSTFNVLGPSIMATLSAAREEARNGDVRGEH